MTTEQRSAIYDPHALVKEVVELLRRKGLEPNTEPGYLGDAVGGAGMLLRALKIRPAIDSVEAFKRSSDKIWGESQDAVQD